MQLPDYAENVRLAEDGIWYSNESEAVSFPDDGHVENMRLQSDSYWFTHRNKIICSALHQWRPAGVFFDIGGGTGVVSRELQAAGQDCVLVEPGIQGAKIARRAGMANVICGTSVTAGLRRDSLPAIGVFDVVEHVEDDLGFVRHLQSLLIPGGYLYLTVPAYQWLWSVNDVHAGHFRRYSLRTMRALLQAAGFQVEYESCIFRPLPLPIFFSRALPSRLGLLKDHQKEKNAREHGHGRGLSRKILERLLEPEVDMVSRGKVMNIGSSIFAVARRV